jgi:hypothetical protein
MPAIAAKINLRYRRGAGSAEGPESISDARRELLDDL